MKISFVFLSVSLISSCLIFTCGCQNESTATRSGQPSPVLYEAPPKARSLSVSEHIGLDQVVSEKVGLFDSKQVNLEEDISQGNSKREPPNLDEIITLESNEFGKLSGDGSEKEDFRK